MAEKVIEIKDLNYVYPDGKIALQNINLDVFQGESLGIIGPNGAGKSTLLLHLNGILRGNTPIKVSGLEINDKNLPSVRSKVGLVFQDPDNQLFMPKVFEDVAFGPLNMGLSEEQVEGRARGALEEVDMLDCTERSPHHLSYGQKKRVSIATVLSMHPQILAMDEPTSNLDPKHRRSLINFLKQLALTKIIATHDLDLVLEVCARVVLLDEGKLIISGEAPDILRNKILLEAHSLELPLSLNVEKGEERCAK